MMIEHDTKNAKDAIAHPDVQAALPEIIRFLKTAGGESWAAGEALERLTTMTSDPTAPYTMGFEPQQRSLLAGEGPFHLEVDIRVEGMRFGGASYDDTAEKIEALYRAYCDVSALDAKERVLQERVSNMAKGLGSIKARCAEELIDNHASRRQLLKEIRRTAQRALSRAALSDND